MLIYSPLQATSAQFVEFWSRRYVYSNEALYDDNIGRELTERRVLDLYEWKNGTPLSARKLASVRRNFIDRLDEIPQLGAGTNAEDFLKRFAEGGAIWRIFWLHCWQPMRFPIYDQHVHRAMTMILGGVPQEIPEYDPRKIDSYIRKYCAFHATFAGIDGRSLDKALWSFGKFLSESNFPTA